MPWGDDTSAREARFQKVRRRVRAIDPKEAFSGWRDARRGGSGRIGCTHDYQRPREAKGMAEAAMPAHSAFGGGTGIRHPTSLPLRLPVRTRLPKPGVFSAECTAAWGCVSVAKRCVLFYE